MKKVQDLRDLLLGVGQQTSESVRLLSPRASVSSRSDTVLFLIGLAVGTKAAGVGLGVLTRNN